MQCLEKNPNKRPQTAHELSEALGALKFEQPWSDERAQLWWKQNHPEAQRATSARDEKERAGVTTASAPAAEAVQTARDAKLE